MGVGQGPDETQAEAKPGGRRGLGVGDPHVRFEDARQGLGRDADTIVFDGQLDQARPVRRGSCLHEDAAAARRVLDGIGQEILQHPVHRVAIGAERRQRLGHAQIEAMDRVLAREDLDIALDELAKIERLAAQRETAAGLDAREVEEIRDNSPKTL